MDAQRFTFTEGTLVLEGVREEGTQAQGHQFCFFVFGVIVSSLASCGCCSFGPQILLFLCVVAVLCVCVCLCSFPPNTEFPYVKDLVNELEADGIVSKDKLGSGVFYWSFPSVAVQSVCQLFAVVFLLFHFVVCPCVCLSVCVSLRFPLSSQ